MSQYTIPSEDNTPVNTGRSKAQVLQQFCKNHVPPSGQRSTVFTPWPDMALVFHDGQLWNFNSNSVICEQEEATTLDPSELYRRVTGNP